MSTVDWYGNVSLVVFWAGCNIRCPYCHNSELLPLDSGTVVDLNLLDERLTQALTPVPSLDAVVFTGGEPILQEEAVIEAAKIVKKHGLGLMLDTNGTLFDRVERILGTGLIDRIALDVKSPLNEADFAAISDVPETSSMHVESIKETLRLCNDLEIPVEARTTIAPGVSDSVDFIKKIARDIKGLYDVYYLQQYDNQGDVLSLELKEKDPPEREELVKLAKAAIGEGLDDVYIKTRFDGLERIE